MYISSSYQAYVDTKRRREFPPTFVHRDKLVAFEHVDIVTPAGNVLLRDLSLSIHHGENIVISGPKGMRVEKAHFPRSVFRQCTFSRMRNWYTWNVFCIFLPIVSTDQVVSAEFLLTVLSCGVAGVGKTSIIRTLLGLWPLSCGIYFVNVIVFFVSNPGQDLL